MRTDLKNDWYALVGPEGVVATAMAKQELKTLRRKLDEPGAYITRLASHPHGASAPDEYAYEGALRQDLAEFYALPAQELDSRFLRLSIAEQEWLYLHWTEPELAAKLVQQAASNNKAELPASFREFVHRVLDDPDYRLVRREMEKETPLVDLDEHS